MLNHLFPLRKKSLGRARIFRKAQMTNAEQLLCDEVRSRRFNGLKFRRQAPLGPYIVDFLCVEKRLVIELDGKSHEGRESYDERRTAYLAEHGLLVLRFPNDDVENDTEDVLRRIADFISAEE